MIQSTFAYSMDSASPIALRTAGQTSDDTGIDFTGAMWTAEKPTFGGNAHGPASGYRRDHRRTHGEGQPA